jgi:hypothetical protein
MASLVARYGYIAPEAQPESWGPDGFIDSLLAVLDWLPGTTTDGRNGFGSASL